ncbi:MAG: histidine phosphatase family protein [Pseudomonadales bacterium]|nr:histidine phosphatase family protein [Pseudomonadales bacterium]
MSVVFLIRHGQASFGSDNYDKLSALGCQQASILGDYFAKAGIHFDAAYAGDLQRQQQTAALALASQPHTREVITDARFNEIDTDQHMQHLLPVLAARDERIAALLAKGAKQSRDFQKMIEATFNYWVSDACKQAGVRSWQDYSSGVAAAFSELKQLNSGGKTVAVFSSGGTIATLVAQVLGLGGAHTYRFYEPMINCSITQILYGSDKASLSVFNDVSYLHVASHAHGENLLSYR